MTDLGVERRLTTVVAADVVGYSRLVEADEAGTLAALKRLRLTVLEPLLAEHRGRLVKLMGDGLIAEFGSVVGAVACAAAIQTRLAEGQDAIPPERRIVLRIGINLGDVVVEGDDLLGDGVNVAARLEQACPPGGVLVSGPAYDQLTGKIDVPFESAGELRLKNIARPVRAYRMVPGGSLAPLATVPLVDRPAVAVLPFDNMSGDPEQVYFSDGITEDIITELSRFRELMVIARNSSFAFRGKNTDVREIGHTLGAGYVVEGSVRRAGNRLRITAQLVGPPREHTCGPSVTIEASRTSSTSRRRSPRALWRQWRNGFSRTVRRRHDGGRRRTSEPMTCSCAATASRTCSRLGRRIRRVRCSSRRGQSTRLSRGPIQASPTTIPTARSMKESASRAIGTRT